MKREEELLAIAKDMADLSIAKGCTSYVITLLDEKSELVITITSPDNTEEFAAQMARTMDVELTGPGPKEVN